MVTAISTRAGTIDSTSRPTYPTSVNLLASTLRKGALARRASRRAISVLPTPVGPIIRMFLGAMSSASSGGSCCRRQRLRKAMATARFACFCPTTYLSSSATICRGVMFSIARLLGASLEIWRVMGLSELLDREVVVGENADLGGDPHRLAHHVLGGHRGVPEQGSRGGQRVVGSGADGEHGLLLVRLHQLADAGDEEALLLVGDDDHRLQLPQRPVGPPVLGQLDDRPLEIAVEFLELLLQAADERQRVRPAAGEAHQHLGALADAPDLARAALDDGALIHRNLPVARHAHLAVAAHEQDRG